MGRKRYTVEQIIRKLREAEVGLAQGSKTPQVCRKLGISEQTYFSYILQDTTPIRANLGKPRGAKLRVLASF